MVIFSFGKIYSEPYLDTKRHGAGQGIQTWMMQCFAKNPAQHVKEVKLKYSKWLDIFQTVHESPSTDYPLIFIMLITHLIAAHMHSTFFSPLLLEDLPKNGLFSVEF